MRHKKTLCLLIVFAFLLMFPTAIFAQTELIQTFTSDDGKFSMRYPEGWKVTVEKDGLIRFNGSAGFLQISFYDNNNSGYPPVTAMELLEVGIGKGPQRMLGFSEPEKVVIGGYPALVSRSDTVSQLQAVIDFGDGVLATAIGYGPDGGLGDSESVFMLMIGTIKYGDKPPPPIVTSSIDSAKAITPENAASVSQLMTIGDATVPVESIAFSPDGRVLAIGTSDGNVQLWDTATRESRMVLKGHAGGATSVAFGAGGYNIVVGTGMGQVRLWDATSGESYGTLQTHDTRVESVASVAQGFLIASGAQDGSVKLWDIAAAKEQPALSEKDDRTPVTSIAFSPDDKMLAAGGGKTIRLWDVTASGSAATVLETEIDGISSVSFSSDGASLIYGGAGTAVWVWDLKNDNHALLEGDDQQVSALVFGSNGQVIVSGDADGIHLWDAAKGTKLATLTSPQAVDNVAINPDGTLIASAGQAGGVVLWGTTGAGGSSQTGDTSASTGTTSQTTTTENTAAASASTCTITAPGSANLRNGPGTQFDRAGTLSGGQKADVNGQAQGIDGMTWYRLSDATWVRSDVVGSPAECAGVPTVTP